MLKEAYSILITQLKGWQRRVGDRHCVNVSERRTFSQVIPDHSNVLFYLLEPAFKICLARKRETDGYRMKLYFLIFSQNPVCASCWQVEYLV